MLVDKPELAKLLTFERGRSATTAGEAE